MSLIPFHVGGGPVYLDPLDYFFIILFVVGGGAAFRPSAFAICSRYPTI